MEVPILNFFIIKRLFFSFCLAVLGFYSVPGITIDVSQSKSVVPCDLVILAARGDPYYPLAEEISAAEKAPLVTSLSDAMACQPVFLLWVVSPSFLSDPVLIDFSMAMKDRTSAVSTGIITASTMEGARILWQRSSQVRGQTFIAVNAANLSAQIPEGVIHSTFQGQTTSVPLSKDRFINALQNADYLTFTGHGANAFLRLDEVDQIRSNDVPSLHSIIVSTGSCQTVRPWNEGSIALRFIDQGAAAYSGFVFSPNEGYLMGEFTGMPFRYSHAEFPIGHILQVQNRGTQQGFTLFPIQFLLGDPRLVLQKTAPYQLVSDIQKNEVRILTYNNVPNGIIPIRIPGGASYQFVEVPAVNAASDQDPFYNSRLQMVNIRNDKFILLENQGGDLILRLSSRPPWYWFPMDILRDSFDHTIIYSPQTGGDLLCLIFAVIPLLWIVRLIIKQQLSGLWIRTALIFGLGVAALHALYYLLPPDWVTITSKDVRLSSINLAAIFLLNACGCLVFLQSRKFIGKQLALVIITFPCWSSMLFACILVTGFNGAAFAPRYGVWLYNYSISLLAGISLLVTYVISGLALRIISKIVIHP